MGDVQGGSQLPLHDQVSGPDVGSTQQSRLSPPGGGPQLLQSSEQSLDPQPTAQQHSNQPLFRTSSQHQFNSPFPNQYDIHAPLQTNLSTSSQNVARTQPPGRGSFNLTSLGAALPHDNTDYRQTYGAVIPLDNNQYGEPYGQQSSQRFTPGPPPSGLVYQLPQTSQYTSQIPLNQTFNPPYNIQYPQHYQGRYHQQQQSPLLQQGGSSPSPQFIDGHNFLSPAQAQQVPAYFYPPNQYVAAGQLYQANPQPPYVVQYGARETTGVDVASSTHPRAGENRGGQDAPNIGSPARVGSTATASGQTSGLRGPPRKPKQSGHALWVGNLPPGTNIIDLKDHFSRDATVDILSVFLISKSNCAFVNYKTEEGCAAAMARFHDSRFQGVRLVCRLRRSAVKTASAVPTGPAASLSSQAGPSEPTAERRSSPPESNIGAKPVDDSLVATPPTEKFFVVKSLTVEDLELSVRNGVWATQSHNEATLNKAYQNADNVYLIFSANKSGEYFGYARMTSPINDDPAIAIEFAPKAQATEDLDLPKAIATPATEFAPIGRIIDDSARGTIFWEAELDQDEGLGESEEQRSDQSDQEGESSPPAKAWGKPFKVEWISTSRLPFYRTRGLRNPWNSNREVKIARDGTELETSVGRRLIQMFHRDSSPAVPNMQLPMSPTVDGYPQMRPY